MIKADFVGRTFDFAMEDILSDYVLSAEAVGHPFGTLALDPSFLEVIADVIWRDANAPDEHWRFL